MNPFEKAIVGEIPLGEACEFFLKLKYGSAGPRPSPEVVLGDFSKMSAAERAEILEEAGLTSEEHEQVKSAAAKKAYAEKLLPGTEGYYSDRMLSVLQSLPPKVFTPEGVDYTTVHGEKLAAAFKLALEQTPSIQEYLSREQEGMAAQEQNESGFLRDRMMQQQQQLQTAQQGQQATQQQMQALEQQISQSQAQIQMAQDSAMQAQTMATQAQQGQLSATDEALRNAQLAAQMRMAYQQLRSQMMDVASQDPAAGLADQLKGMTGMQDPMASMGAPPTAGPPSPEMGPAGQAPGAPAAPGAAPPEGETGANNANADGKEPLMQSAAPTGKNDIKQANARLMGAAIGAGIGGLGTAVESQLGTEDLRKRVHTLEGREGGGFVNALNIAQAKARLALSEAAEQHPVSATLAGSLIGAGIGAGAGPAVHSLMK